MENIKFADKTFKMRNSIITIILILLLTLLFFVDLTMGSSQISLREFSNTFNNTNPICNILVNLRLTRAITAIVTGAALSVAGVLMQTLFFNPLAGPYVLGISSGASLGVAILTMAASFCGFSPYFLGNWSFVLFAITGASLVLLAVSIASAYVKNSVTLLIVGIMFGSMVSAIISLLQSISDPDSLKLFINWTMGNLDTVTWEQLKILTPCIITCLCLSIFLHKKLDSLLMGEEYASSLGVNIKMLRLKVIILTSVLSGISTAFTGPIGFIGLAVPHIAKGIYRTALHHSILPASMLCGSILLLACDIISHIPQSGYVLPINAICALIGAPFIVFIVLKKL